MFYAVLALLASRKKETSKHSGFISLFDKEYVRPGAFPKGFSKWLDDAFNLQQQSDYMVRWIPAVEEAEELIKQARSFLDRIRERLKEWDNI